MKTMKSWIALSVAWLLITGSVPLSASTQIQAQGLTEVKMGID